MRVNKRLGTPLKKTVALIDIDSIPTPQAARGVINALRSKQVTDVYFLSSVTPTSAHLDVQTFLENSQTKNAANISKRFQQEHFNVTVITPLDSASSRTGLGEAYRTVVTPFYDAAMAMNMNTSRDNEKILNQQYQAAAQALRNQDKEISAQIGKSSLPTNEAAKNLMFEKFIQYKPTDVGNVLYFGDQYLAPSQLIESNRELKENNRIVLHNIKLTSDPNEIQQQVDNVSLASLPLRLPSPSREKIFSQLIAEIKKEIDATPLEKFPQINGLRGEVNSIINNNARYQSAEEKRDAIVKACEKYHYSISRAQETTLFSRNEPQASEQKWQPGVFWKQAQPKSMPKTPKEDRQNKEPDDKPKIGGSRRP